MINGRQSQWLQASKEEEDNVEEKLDPTTAEMHIEFDDVSYTFPTRYNERTVYPKCGSIRRCQPVLQNLSFTLAPGDSIALVGKSGCGKSCAFCFNDSTIHSLSSNSLLASYLRLLGKYCWMDNHWKNTIRRSGDGSVRTASLSKK